MSAREAAERFEVGVSTTIVWVRRARVDGERSARRQGQPKGSKLDAQRDYLLGLVEATTDITLKKMRAQLRGKGRGGRDRHAVALLPGPGLHGKETAHTAEQDRADVLARREAWFEG